MVILICDHKHINPHNKMAALTSDLFWLLEEIETIHLYLCIHVKIDYHMTVTVSNNN